MTLNLDAAINRQLSKAQSSKGAFRNVFNKAGVRHTPDFDRIARLPRRVWSEADATALADRLTDAIRQSGSNWSLMPTQAIALWEMHQCKGLFAPIAVGGGKTLITFLAPWFLDAKRPLLIVPGNLARKTDSEYAAYSQAFQLPPKPYVVSYSKLSRDSGKALLKELRPDAIICDEAHRLKNPKAAVTRRVRRYMNERPDTKFVALSGTITKRSIRDYAHLLGWSLDAVPIPTGWAELETWADALDERVQDSKRVQPGALLEFASQCDHDIDPLVTARRGYARRLLETPGVVAGRGKSEVDAGLEISSIVLEPTERITNLIRGVRTSWTRPDGFELFDGPTVRACILQLVAGFYYHWDPLPPIEWLNARRAWAAEVRDVLKTSGRYDIDTEFQVAGVAYQASIGHRTPFKVPDSTVEAYRIWHTIGPTFKPNVVSAWVDSYLVDFVLDWAHKHKGLVWIEHKALGLKLEERGLPYYGEGGIRKTTKEYVEDAEGPIALSIQANSTGRNLQFKHSKNLVVTPPANGSQWEQMLGRTHRKGQPADTVTYETIVSCAEHYGALIKSRRDSLYQQDSLQSEHKLQVATWDVEDCSERRGPAWEK